MTRASGSESVVVPRALRMNLFVRLIMPWRLPAWADFTFPVAVSLNRFFAPDLVFNLGILRPFFYVVQNNKVYGCIASRHGMPCSIDPLNCISTRTRVDIHKRTIKPDDSGPAPYRGNNASLQGAHPIILNIGDWSQVHQACWAGKRNSGALQLKSIKSICFMTGG